LAGGAGTYATIAEAVTAAEALTQSAETDEVGVTVHIPGGDFNENVVIRRNVHLKGAGRYATAVTKVTYRPTDATLAPQSVSLAEMLVETLEAYNETNPSSGVFNQDWMLSNLGNNDNGLAVYNCRVFDLDLKNVFFVGFFDCQLGVYNPLILNNIDVVAFHECTSTGTVELTMDSSDPNRSGFLADPEDPESRSMSGSLRVIECSDFVGVTLRTIVAPSEYKAVLGCYGSFVNTIDLGADTTGGISGSAMLSLIADAAASYSLKASQVYGATQPSNWNVVPKRVNEAVDELASRTKTLETAPSVVSDEAYNETTWDGVTGTSPSKNAVRDKIVSMDSAIDGKAAVSHTHVASNVTDFDAAAKSAAVSDVAYAASWDGITDVAPSKNAVYDKVEALDAAKAAASHTHTASQVTDFDTAAKTAAVSDAAYGAGWDGVTDVAPSKNAVYDKIVAMGEGPGAALVAIWVADVTKTNIATSYVYVYSGSTYANQARLPVEFTKYTQYKVFANWNKVGTGTQSLRVVDHANNANVLHEFSDATAAGEKEHDSGWQNIPGWASGGFLLALQMKSTLSTDDPVFRRCVICLK